MIESPFPEPAPIQAAPKPPALSVPWTLLDSWIGVALLIVIETILVLTLYLFPALQIAQNAGLIVVQLTYLLPVVIVFLWRRSGWRFIGFRKFSLENMAIGCGLLIGAYLITIAHNVILTLWGVETQGQELISALGSLDTSVWFLFVGIFLAPFVEEIFFRGFLFQGFRNKMGWIKAALLSSAIFAAGHLDLAALIPTFVLGFTFSYIFHKSNSVWPGMILHFIVNAFGLTVVFLAIQFKDALP